MDIKRGVRGVLVYDTIFYMQDLFLKVAYFLAILLAPALGVFVYTGNKQSSVNRLFAALSAIFTAWIAVNLMCGFSDNPIWVRLTYAFGSFLPLPILIFICKLGDIKVLHKFLFVGWAVTFLFFFLALTDLVIKKVTLVRVGGFEGELGLLYPAWTIFMVVIILFEICVIFKLYRRSDGIKKMQLQYLMLGFFVLAAVCTVLDVAMPLLGNTYWMSYDCLSVLIFLAFTAYAIVKYQFMNIKVVITRAGIFALVYCFILWLPLWLGYKTDSWLLTGLTMLILATIGPFIYTRLRLRIEKLFFHQEKIKLIQEEQLRRQKTIDTFSGSMAHEIANPIHVIVGLIDMVKIKTLGDLKDNIPEKDRAYLEERFKTISEGAFRIAGMVKTIREFSSQTTGTFKPVALKEVIKNVLTMLSGKLKEETINLEVSLVDDITVIGNKIALEETILNILLNSIEAFANCETTDKEIIITASLQPNNKALVTISDNACGIPENMLNDIFLDFVTTKPSSSNLGMGLSLCRKIIALHKGKIWAQSPGENKGADIFIELPINGLV